MKNLAERLAWARQEKEFSQGELAKKAGVSQGTIGNLESGIRSSARRITAISAALGVDAAWLAEGKGRAHPEQGVPIVPTEAPSPVDRVADNDLRQALLDQAKLLELYWLTDDVGREGIMKKARLVKKILRPDVALHKV